MPVAWRECPIAHLNRAFLWHCTRYDAMKHQMINEVYLSFRSACVLGHRDASFAHENKDRHSTEASALHTDNRTPRVCRVWNTVPSSFCQCAAMFDLLVPVHLFYGRYSVSCTSKASEGNVLPQPRTAQLGYVAIQESLSNNTEESSNNKSLKYPRHGCGYYVPPRNDFQ